MKNQYSFSKNPAQSFTPFKNVDSTVEIFKMSAQNGPKQNPIEQYKDYLDRAGLGFWRFYCNENLVELCSVSRRLTQLKSIQSLYSVIKKLHPSSRKSFFTNLIETTKCCEKFEEEIQVTFCEGQSKWFKINGILEQQTDGSHCISGTLIDISALKIAEIQKMDLMAFMSHELKTPLSTFKLYVQSAAKFVGCKSKSFVQDQLRKADAQVTTMHKLIDQYLELATAVNTHPEVKSESFNFSELVYETVSHYAEINPDYVFKMELNGSVFLQADRNQISQVMNNLIGNAVKFSKTNSFIKVCCKRTNKGVEFSVTDQGRGISLTDQKQLFTKHFRAKYPANFTVKGHGLGLYLSKQIVEAHHGTVFCESKLGLGSIFGFTLPNQSFN